MSNWFLYVVTVLVWGSTWIAIEFQLGTVAPEVSIFYRYLLAAGLLFSWCRYRGLNLRFDIRAHVDFLMLGVLLFSLNYITAYYAQLYITSARTSRHWAIWFRRHHRKMACRSSSRMPGACYTVRS